MRQRAQRIELGDRPQLSERRRQHLRRDGRLPGAEPHASDQHRGVGVQAVQRESALPPFESRHVLAARLVQDGDAGHGEARYGVYGGERLGPRDRAVAITGGFGQLRSQMAFERDGGL